MTTTQKRRLAKLERFIRNLDDKLNIQMESWVNFDPTSENKVTTKNIKKQVIECGTAACAAGYCPVIFPTLWKYDFVDGIIIPQLKKAPFLQRLGYFFELLDLDELALLCEKELKKHSYVKKALLDPNEKTDGAGLNTRWNLIINTELEIEHDT